MTTSATETGAFARRRPKTAALVVFLGCLAIYHANGRPITQNDVVPAPYAAWTLVRRGSFDLREHEYLLEYVGRPIIELPNGQWVYRYPPGNFLAAVPFLAPLAVLSDEPPPPSRMRKIGKLVGAVYVAAAVVLFYFLCLRLTPRAATLATVFLAFGASLWSTASQALWMHGPGTFWLTAAMALLLMPRDGLGKWASRGLGLALGLAFLTRPSSALFGVATGVALLMRREWRAAVTTATWSAVPVAGYLAYNAAVFGRPTAGGYDILAILWSTPLWIGLPGLLVAPSRGLVIYSLPVVLAPWGLAAAGRSNPLVGPRRRTGIWLWSIAAAATIVLYARFIWWWGGWCFGPRYLTEIMPILALLVALAYDRLQSTRWRRVVIAMVVVAVAVQVVGVFGHHDAWNVRHADPGQGEIYFELTDTQIEAHVRVLVSRIASLFGG